MKALVLCSSPRRDGNSSMLAQRAARGLADAGHEVDLLHADDVLNAFLRDCRRCRKPSGECAIDDGFRNAFFDKYLPADGFIAATPIYWYGMSAQLKTFFDRMFCYVAASHPSSPAVVEGMRGKRIGLILSSEETFPMVSAGIVQQINEYCRYTRSTFVGVVHGYGNARGEVARDPHEPLAQAYRLGNELFTFRATDYHIDTPRDSRVWADPAIG
jgi:multimeric flavodoxin WrbA